MRELNNEASDNDSQAGDDTDVASEPVVTTYSGRIIKPIERLMKILVVQCKGTAAKLRCLRNMAELEHEEMFKHDLADQDLNLSSV